MRSVADFIVNRWILWVALLVFIIIKIPHLHYAFHWDECWVYGPAVKTMARNGISFLPGSLDPTLSRGHPHMFYVWYALWLKVFGFSNQSLHSFGLTISCILLISVYEIGQRIFNKRVGVLALLLVTTQVIFITMSSSVLPEAMLTLFALLAVYCYVQNKYWLTMIFLAMLLFTKEIGSVLGLILGINATAMLFYSSRPLKARILNLLSVVVPGILIVLFFLRQKAVFGWFILPDHSSLLSWTWKSFYGTYHTVIYFMFLEDYRNYLFEALIVLAVVTSILRKKNKYLFLLFPALAVFMLIDTYITGHMGDVLLVVLLPVSLFACVYALFKSGYFTEAIRLKFTTLVTCFIVGTILFSSISFFTYRYLLPTVIFMCLLVAIYIDYYFRSLFLSGYYFAGAFIIALGIYAYQHDEGFGDTDVAQYNAIKVHQATVDYLEDHDLYGKGISAGSFLQLAHLVRTENGFLRSDRIFWHLIWHKYTDGSDYVLLDNVDPACDLSVKNDTAFHLIYRTTSGDCWSEIYARNQLH